VSTREQFELLASIDCHIFQGFFFSKGVPEDEFIAMLPTEENKICTPDSPGMEASAHC